MNIILQANQPKSFRVNESFNLEKDFFEVRYSRTESDRSINLTLSDIDGRKATMPVLLPETGRHTFRFDPDFFRGFFKNPWFSNLELSSHEDLKIEMNIFRGRLN